MVPPKLSVSENYQKMSLMIITTRAPGSDWAEFERVLCPLAEEEEEVKVSWCG